MRRGLHFGQTRQTGIVFHMLSALGSTGRLGLIAVGNSPEEAREIFEHAEKVLDEEPVSTSCRDSSGGLGRGGLEQLGVGRNFVERGGLDRDDGVAAGIVFRVQLHHFAEAMA